MGQLFALFVRVVCFDLDPVGNGDGFKRIQQDKHGRMGDVVADRTGVGSPVDRAAVVQVAAMSVADRPIAHGEEAGRFAVGLDGCG